MNSPYLIETARELRKVSTAAEKYLWSHLRNRFLKGIKFYRQYPISGYVLDFYCKKAKLGIELDGAGHLDAEQRELDRIRTSELEDYGIIILRFWNQQVMDDIGTVLDRIEKIVVSRIMTKHN